MTYPVAGVDATSQSSAATAATTATPAAASTSNSMLDPQAFLQLLVAQLQYQDPSNPTDTSTFMNQTATLSQVQTMNAMSSTLSSLVSAQQSQAATDLIGKQISYVDAGGLRTSGVVTSASLQASGATVGVGDTSVALDKVLEVTNAPSP